MGGECGELGKPPAALLEAAGAGDTERGGDKNVSDSGDDDRATAVACDPVAMHTLSLPVAECGAGAECAWELPFVPTPA